MATDEHKMLICRNTAIPGYVVPGSLPGRCDQCGSPVSIAPSSWLFLHDNPGMEVVCFACGSAYIKKHGGTVDPPTPAQLEEIEEARRSRET